MTGRPGQHIGSGGFIRAIPSSAVVSRLPRHGLVQYRLHTADETMDFLHERLLTHDGMFTLAARKSRSPREGGGREFSVHEGKQ